MVEKTSARRFDTNRIDQMLKNLRRLPGDIRLTLFHPSGISQQYVLSENQDEQAIQAIRNALGQLSQSPAGSLLVRQELAFSAIVETNGVTARKPHYRVYGAFVSNGMFLPTDVKILKQCYETDADTVEHLQREPGVHFADFGKLLAGDSA